MRYIGIAISVITVSLATLVAEPAWAGGGFACCFPDASCQDLTEADCLMMGGVWVGGPGARVCAEIVGTPLECLPVATGACCDDAFMCTEVAGERNCPAPSIYFGDGTTCDPDPCGDVPPDGACCDLAKGCFVTTENNCGATWIEDARCSPGLCDDVIPGACCSDVGPVTTCADTVSGNCVNANQTFFANEQCINDPCGLLPEGACCTDTGEGITCSIGLELNCQQPGQTYQGDETNCCPNPCLEEVPGACCTIGGGCALTLSCECIGQDQEYQGDGTVCDPDPCTTIVGACCTSDGKATTCAETTPDDCIGDGQAYAGDGTSCDDDPCTGIFCASTADCADLDANGTRDNNCLWWECTANGCVPTDIVFADMGGQFGVCPPDGTADGNDRFQALNCFSGVAPDGGVYECEPSPPAAMNVDAGGQFGSCFPDGVCDGNDAFAALNAFGNNTTCSCPLDGGPNPDIIAPHTNVAEAFVSLRRKSTLVSPDAFIAIEVHLDKPLHDLRGYQLHLGVEGGTHGTLELVDIGIDQTFRHRPQRRRAMSGAHIFAHLPFWEAYNISTGQMVVGLDSPGVAVDAGHLATYYFKPTPQARGTFVIDLLTFDEATPQNRSFLFPTQSDGRITIRTTGPMTVSVE